jgi:hypothetical protein
MKRKAKAAAIISARPPMTEPTMTPIIGPFDAEWMSDPFSTMSHPRTSGVVEELPS